MKKSKLNGKEKKSKGKNKKSKKPKIVVKTVDTINPVSTPIGSVHFDEFLKICREPKLSLKPVEPVKKKKKKSDKNKKNKGGKNKKKIKAGKNKKRGKIKRVGKKNKSSIKKIVENPNDIPLVNESEYPPLFPLIKALLLPTNDDTVGEHTLFSVSGLNLN